MTIDNNSGERQRLEKELNELRECFNSLSEEIQFLEKSERIDDLSPRERFRLQLQIKQVKEERQQLSERITVLEKGKTNSIDDDESDLILGSDRSFSGIDTIHVHVDGGSDKEKVIKILRKLDPNWNRSKLTTISRSVAGPQRDDFPDTYNVHTPGPLIRQQESCEVKEFDYFSTTLLSEHSPVSKNDKLLQRKLKEILVELADTRDIVIELERVISKKSEKIEWSEVAIDAFSPIKPDDIGFDYEETLPLEIHYAIDIEKEGDWSKERPLELGNLLQECKKLNIHVGGWFLFNEKEKKAWAYRSNSFENETSRDKIEKQIGKEWDAFNKYLDEQSKKLDFKYRFNILVEQVLGIWKTPLKKKYDFKTVKELAQWEKDYPSLERFWVVASNFLADKHDMVRSAMISNLRKGVEYTYFISSFADFQRLRKFAQNLEKDLGAEVDVFKKINAVLFVMSSGKNELSREWFIANPHLEGQNRQGYKLKREETGEVFEGIKMKESDYKELLDRLKPLVEVVEDFQVKQWRRIPVKPTQTLKHLILICTELERCQDEWKKIPEQRWEEMRQEMLQEYDSIVAEEVSKLGGTVEKDIHNNGYLITFERNKSAALSALSCVERLQKAVQEYNNSLNDSLDRLPIPPQKIAIDYGEVCQVIRAYGSDLIGINRCQLLLEWTEYGKILMTKAFYEHYSAANWNYKRSEELLNKKFIYKALNEFAPRIKSDCYEYKWSNTDKDIEKQK